MGLVAAVNAFDHGEFSGLLLQQARDAVSKYFPLFGFTHLPLMKSSYCSLILTWSLDPGRGRATGRTSWSWRCVEDGRKVRNESVS